jgi:two-component system invasion response regulator UvrY
MLKSLRVLLVDDHPVVRDGVRHFLESASRIEVAGEAGSGEEACTLYRDLSPDVVVLDLSMEGMGGLETIRRIVAFDSRARLLVFSMHVGEAIIVRAMETGALGYLTKQSGMGQLAEAIRTVAQGGMFVDAKYVPSLRVGKTSQDPLQSLSRREFQLFKLLAEGKSVAEIAQALSISPKTAGVHQTSIMKKLGLSNATQLVRLAIRCNVIEP